MLTLIGVEIQLDCGIDPFSKGRILKVSKGNLVVDLPDIFEDKFDVCNIFCRKMTMDAVAAYLYSMERNGDIEGTINSIKYNHFDYDYNHSLLKDMDDVIVKYDHKLIKEICEETGVNSAFEVFLK